jgi:hypothetical protein
MESYHVLRKLASWPTLAGAALGAFAVAFLVYPPHIGWGSDKKWGDVGGWVGAIATFSAAFVALYLSGKEARLRESSRQLDASILASMLINELQATANASRNLSGALGFASAGKLEQKLGPVRAHERSFQMPLTRDRIERLSVFPRDLALNIATALSNREQVAEAIEWITNARHPVLLTSPGGIMRFEKLQKDASHLRDALYLCLAPCQELAIEGRLVPWHPDFMEKLHGGGEALSDDEPE